jgi:hypothetical protein
VDVPQSIGVTAGSPTSSCELRCIEADEFGSMNECGGAFSSVAETTFVSGVALLVVVLVGLILVFFRPWPKAQSRL